MKDTNKLFTILFFAMVFFTIVFFIIFFYNIYENMNTLTKQFGTLNIIITSISLLIGEYYLTLSGLCFRKLCLEQTSLTLLKTKSVCFLIIGLSFVGLVMTSDIVNENVFGKEPLREYKCVDMGCL